MVTYETLAQQKMKLLMTSNKVKAMSSSLLGWDKVIKVGTPISIDHITALVLYTDLSEYCSHFSATFRKSTQYESFQSIKRRNAKYWWQSKLLREAITHYGLDTETEDYERDENEEKGPFYSGVDVVLCLQRFSLRLRGPTSTSKQLAVALKFSKKEGIIISLNNTGYHNDKYYPFLDCSWFSAFPDEVCYNILLLL